MKQSRVLLYFLCCLSIMTLVTSGCGDDEPSEAPTNELIGTWDLHLLIAANCADPIDNGTETGLCAVDECLKWEFREGGVFVVTDIYDGDSDVSQGTYSISGSSLTITADGETNTGAFTVAGNTFTYDLRDEEFECDIEAQFSRND